MIILLLLPLCLSDQWATLSTNDVEGIRIVRKQATLLTDPENDISWNINRAVRTNGNQIFVAPLSDEVMLLDKNGRLVKTIGRKGNGPGEYVGPLKNLHIKDDGLWLTTPTKVHHYDKGQHQYSFKTPMHIGFKGYRLSSTARTFAVHNDQILLGGPSKKGIKQVATLFSKDGEILKSVQDPTLTEDELNGFYKGKNTLWTFVDNHWYGVYEYIPKLLKYDEDLNFIAAYNLDSPPIRAVLEIQKDRDRPLATFWDFAVHNDKILLATQRGLHVFDRDSLKCRAIYLFKTKGDPDTDEFPQYVMHTFAMLDDGRIILGNSGHEALFISRLD